MTWRIVLGVVLVGLAGALVVVREETTRTTPILLHPCLVQGMTARCATVFVPENRAVPGGRRIGLHVVVIPSRLKPTRPDAFTYLAGGPGVAATANAWSALSVWGQIHEHHDILLVDQRGTGSSHPLACPAPTGPVDTPARAKAYVDACFRSLAGDPTQYGTSAAMDDLDAVRAGLGYRQLDLYGTSYGATAAQVFLKRHPASVRAVVLDGATLLGIPFYSRFAANGERALDQIARRCTAEPACRRHFPRWRAQLSALIKAWNAKPVRVIGSVLLTGDDLAGAIQRLTLTSNGAADIPLLVSQAAAGQVAALENVTRPTGLSRSVMFWSIWCNEPWVGLDAKGPWGSYLDRFTASQLALYRTVCSYMPKRAEPAADWTTPHSDVPVLALAGGADPQDPIGNLAGMGAALPNSKIVVLPGEGHAIGQFGCLPALVAQFIDHPDPGTLDARCANKLATAAFALR